jgi:hypothetical protein
MKQIDRTQVLWVMYFAMFERNNERDKRDERDERDIILKYSLSLYEIQVLLLYLQLCTVHSLLICFSVFFWFQAEFFA